MGKITLGQIGYGVWGSKLLGGFAKHPAFEVIQIAAKNPRLSARDQHNIPFVGVDQLLSNDRIQAVAVATPTSTHFDIGQRVLESGRHLFIEKPLTGNQEESKRLKELADKKGLTIFVDYIFTFADALKEFREEVQTWESGDLQEIHLSMKQPGPFGVEDVFPMLGSHMLAVLSLFCRLDELNFSRHDNFSGDGFAETSTAYFKHKSRQLAGSIELDLHHPTKERKLVAIGKDKKVVVDMAGPGGIDIAVDRFCRVLQGLADSNIDDAVLVDEVLARLSLPFPAPIIISPAK